MTELNLLRGLKENLDNVPIADGNLIVTKDTGEIFADFGADRVALGGNDLPLEKGEGENSIQTAQSKAIGPDTISIGEGAIAGCKGYYYSAIHLGGKCILLSETQVEPVILETNPYGNYYDASFSCEWQVGDKISIVNGAHYDEQLTIREIDGNIIFVAESIPFGAIQTGDSADDYTVCVPARPEAGVVPLGEGAIAAGDGGSATGRGAVNFARDGRAFGDYSFNVGRDNEVGYASAALGAQLKHPAQYGLSGGWGNETPADFAITLGAGLINPYENGVILGWCNDPTIPDLLLGIGCGFDGERKNALSIDKKRNVWVDKDPTMPMGVATKQYVDTIENTLGTTIKQKQDLIKREVISVTGNALKKLDANKYYVADTNGGQIPFINITLNDPTNTDIVNEYKLRISNIDKVNFFTSKGTENADNIINIRVPANLTVDANQYHVITTDYVVSFTNITLEDGLADKEYKLRINGLNGVNFYNAKTDEVITISAPTNLVLAANKYYEITANGVVDFTNVTLNDGTANGYKLRVNNISRLDFYTPGGARASIEGLPETYEEGKTYEISIINGVATYTAYPTSVEGLPDSYDASKTYEISIINGVATYTTYSGDGTVKGLPESYDASKVYEISIIDGYGKYIVLEDEHEWQNPPLYPGVEYRTTERWNGKPVYVKMINCGLLPAVGTTADISHGISCTQVIRTEGQMLYDGSFYGGDSLPYYRIDYGADIRITSTRFGVKLSVVSWDKDPSQISNVEASATIYYIKE